VPVLPSQRHRANLAEEHGVSLRTREDAEDLVKKLNPPKEVEFFLGSHHEVRFLKKEGYGKFAMLSK
jgi:hypothetical protein